MCESILIILGVGACVVVIFIAGSILFDYDDQEPPSDYKFHGRGSPED